MARNYGYDGNALSTYLRIGQKGGAAENEFDVSDRKLSRRRAIADALLGQAMQPSAYVPTMVPGPYGPVVAGNVLGDGASKIGSLIGSFLASRGVDEDEKALLQKRQDATRDWAGGLDMLDEGVPPNQTPGAEGPNRPLTRGEQMGYLLEGSNLGGMPAKISEARMGAMFAQPKYVSMDLGGKIIRQREDQPGEWEKTQTPGDISAERRHLTPSGSVLAQIDAKPRELELQSELARRLKQTPGAPSVSVSYSRADPESLRLRAEEIKLARERGGTVAGGAADAGGYMPPEGYKAVKMPRPMTPAATMGANEATLAAEQMESIVSRQQALHPSLAKRYGSGLIGKGAAWLGEQAGQDPELDEYLAGQRKLVQLGLVVQKGVQTEGDALRELQSSPRVNLTQTAHKNLTDRALDQARRAREVNEAAMNGYVLNKAKGDAPPAAAAPAQAPAGQPKRISTDAEFDALPSGAQFVGPDGKVRRKP